MAKRAFDLAFALTMLLVTAPLLLAAMLLIWLEDGGAPLYLGERIGQGGRPFRIVKLRSLRVGAEVGGSTLTPDSDSRITPIGRHLRRLKIDELGQLWNVLRGEMSVVGPRPNTWRDGVDRYTHEELGLLAVRPGITDAASIVFSDEGRILRGARDPEALHDLVVRPWKSRLGLLYIAHRTFADDLRLIALTGLTLIAKPAALRGVDHILARWRADDALRRVCRQPGAPPIGLPPGVPA